MGRRYFTQVSMKRLLGPEELAPLTRIVIPLAPIHGVEVSMGSHDDFIRLEKKHA